MGAMGQIKYFNSFNSDFHHATKQTFFVPPHPVSRVLQLYILITSSKIISSMLDLRKQVFIFNSVNLIVISPAITIQSSY